MQGKPTYVVAVSGGIDSVALLDMLVNQEVGMFGRETQYIVAHVDHGMREHSNEDAQFVAQLAKNYGLGFECYEAALGTQASEDGARRVRYNFLRHCCKKYKALGIITAHHRNDLLETAIINLIRGTAWRGLAPMTEQNEKLQIYRPLLSMTKREILSYAKSRGLKWREDHTNTNQDFLRNYVRLTLLPRAQRVDSNFQGTMFKYIAKSTQLRERIEEELNIIVGAGETSSTFRIRRYELIMWSPEVAREVIYTILTRLDAEWHPTAQQLKRVLYFAKTAQKSKLLQVSKRLQVRANTKELTFQFTE